MHASRPLALRHQRTFEFDLISVRLLGNFRHISLALRGCLRLLLGVCCIGFVAAAYNLVTLPPARAFLQSHLSQSIVMPSVTMAR